MQGRAAADKYLVVCSIIWSLSQPSDLSSSQPSHLSSSWLVPMVFLLRCCRHLSPMTFVYSSLDALVSESLPFLVAFLPSQPPYMLSHCPWWPSGGWL